MTKPCFHNFLVLAHILNLINPSLLDWGGLKGAAIRPSPIFMEPHIWLMHLLLTSFLITFIQYFRPHFKRSKSMFLLVILLNNLSRNTIQIWKLMEFFQSSAFLLCSLCYTGPACYILNWYQSLWLSVLNKKGGHVCVKLIGQSKKILS